MATDTVLEEQKFPCANVPVEELSRIAYSISRGIPTNADALRIGTYRIHLSKIPWQQIRQLHIDVNPGCFLGAGVSPGAYINTDGSFLLSIGKPKEGIQKILDNCGSNLESLSLWNHSEPGLNLFSLSKLKQLNIWDAASLLSIDGLELLHYLQHFTLSRCKQITRIKLRSRVLTNISGLDTLSSLTDIDLSGCESITSVSWANDLSQLISLNLSGCSNLTSLPDLSPLTKLEVLDLSATGITVLPESLRHLSSLSYLILSELKLKELPYFLPEIASKFTYDPDTKIQFELERKFDELFGRIPDIQYNKANIALFDTTIEGVDMSIFDQPYEMVVNWFREREAGRTIRLSEIKVVFLGDGEAGKSHTIARLMNNGGAPVDYMDKSTPGIVIKHQDYQVNGRNFKVHYWDFGGQEIMHSMHRIFLTNRTMYVVLINSRDDTQGDRARYWLQNIQSFAPDAPVLLVLNKIDMNQKASVDERDLRARFPKLTQIVRLSALTYDQKTFNQAFTDVLLDEIQKTGYLDVEWRTSWIKVKQALEKMKTHYILGKDYKRICKECQVDDEKADLLRWFNDLGVSFCFCDKEDYSLKKHVILRPDWITNGLYIILFNDCPGAVNGLIPHSDIYELLDRAASDATIQCTLPGAKYDRPGDVEYVLGIMRKFQLSLKVGEDQEFIPMLCQKDSTLDIQYYEKDADTLEFRMEFEHLPNNTLHRLMVERHSELDMDNVWRTGARFVLSGTGISAVVVIDGDTLKFFIRHTDPMHRPNTYLTMLKANIDRIVQRMGIQEPENVLVYKLDGKTGTFDYEELKQAKDYGETTVFSKVWKRRLPIADILNQSAPESLDNERKLLHSVQKACEQIQREPECRGSKEDNRNRRMRDALENRGYEVYDQRQMGASGTRKDVGELDMMLYREERDQKKPWSIIEALRVDDGAKRDWNNHLGKVLDNYNPHGVPFLFLVTYSDCEKPEFERIWTGYQEHIQKHNAGKFEYQDGSFQMLNTEQDSYYIQVAVSRYRCGGYMPTVYHIFVQMDPK